MCSISPYDPEETFLKNISQKLPAGHIEIRLPGIKDSRMIIAFERMLSVSCIP
jgi:hypothetical protein